MPNAQGSLEYMVIIAVVLAIAGITTLYMSGLLSSQSSQVSVATCKQASQNCELSRLSSPSDPCVSCNAACQNPSTNEELFVGAVYCCNHTRSELIYADSTECAALVCHNDQLDAGEQCDDGFDSACPGDCVDCQCQCAAGEILCPGIGCKSVACSSNLDCPQPLPTNCIQSSSCVNPGDPCTSYCDVTYKATGASCGTPTYTYYCSGISTRCTVTTSRTCNAAHTCASSSSTLCASCSPNCCLGVWPSAYCGTCTANCGGLITCTGSTPVCCVFPTPHCCASACGAFGGCA